MFEYKLQKSWDNYRDDFGLGRISLIICFFCLFIFIYSLVFLNDARFSSLIPIVIVYCMTLFGAKIKSSSHFAKFLINVIFLGSMIPFLYDQTGILDETGHGLQRFDEFFATFDQKLWGDSIANIIQRLAGTSFFATLYYDWIQTAYLFYFLFPFYMCTVYYCSLPEKLKFKVARPMASVTIFFCFNYFLYIVIPVTGPQFFIPSAFVEPLPLSSYGYFLNSIVKNGQPTFIDCFPSGHTGISLLMSLWFFKMKSKHFYFSCFMGISIILATVSLRYHYTLDLISSIPLVIFSYKFSASVIPVSVRRIYER
ncbi:phosphatase PAP2 family protein [Halobacteriovorax sp. HLS]|uniref:phosphatase PAP2 family protein n=1 Tax=Halobacteriovorax sp. HLS TaxID=2234000 RepID=UPI000FD81931|nr:phosphatase PAP2 family protein [Halobacteriovorax sp. HLS]